MIAYLSISISIVRLKDVIDVAMARYIVDQIDKHGADNRLEGSLKMTVRTPLESKNLDSYGNPELPWSRAITPLINGALKDQTSFLGTIRPNGRPHSARVGAVWYDGDLYFTSHAESQKGRNLAANPDATVSVGLDGIDLTFEGQATRVTDPVTLTRIAEIYSSENGWPAEVAGETITAPYSAPAAGPAPWNLYRFTFHTAYGTATAEPYGATRWRFTD